ncbi:MAG TPA: PilZ domain-containing protein [Gammaproteobacteria bacterium]|nr:PilZ domain-containing protein [Gammaproteobacteria bacterium]
MSVERRLTPRRKLQLGVMLETPTNGQPVAATLCNISEGGAYIETRAALSTSAPLIMAFQLAGTRLRNGLRLYARVIHRDDNGIGVAFLPMPEDMTRTLSDALSGYEAQQEAQL